MPGNILYYDGQCPLCSAEMQKLKNHSNGQLQLQDIHSLQEKPDLPNKQDLLTILHLANSDGEFLTGLDANVNVAGKAPTVRFYRLMVALAIHPDQWQT